MMNQLNNHDYYTTRAECAHRLERQAASPSIAALHAQMASHYEESAIRAEIVIGIPEAKQESQLA